MESKERSKSQNHTPPVLQLQYSVFRQVFRQVFLQDYFFVYRRCVCRRTLGRRTLGRARSPFFSGPFSRWFHAPSSSIISRMIWMQYRTTLVNVARHLIFSGIVTSYHLIPDVTHNQARNAADQYRYGRFTRSRSHRIQEPPIRI